MLCGLTNAKASFPEIINTIFKDVKGCIWHLNDIRMCYSNTEPEHQATVEKEL